MKTDLYTYIIDEKWKKPGSDITTKTYGYMGCEYNFPETAILTNFERTDDGMIHLSLSIPEWNHLKRFARLILTPEEAKALKEQL